MDNRIGDSGALFWKTLTAEQMMAMGSTNIPGDIGLNAAKSNSIFGSSSSVLPPSAALLPCIKA